MEGTFGTETTLFHKLRAFHPQSYPNAQSHENIFDTIISMGSRNRDHALLRHDGIRDRETSDTRGCSEGPLQRTLSERDLAHHVLSSVPRHRQHRLRRHFILEHIENIFGNTYLSHSPHVYSCACRWVASLKYQGQKNQSGDCWENMDDGLTVHPPLIPGHAGRTMYQAK